MSWPAAHVAGAESAATAPISETEAVERALALPALTEVIDGAVGSARGDAVEAGLWPNPELSWVREDIDGSPAASTEDFIVLSHRLDLSGRRGLERKAADRRALRSEHEGEALRRDVAAETRLRFFDLLRQQERVAAVHRFATRLARLSEATARREAAGDVSGYDRRRIGREQALASARLLVEEAALARARELLEARIGPGASAPGAPPAATGTLLPDRPLPAIETTLAAIETLPGLRALDEDSAAAELERKAASRWWLSEVEIGGGYKNVALPDESLSGFLVSVSIPLPLFDRSQGRALGADSRRRLALGRRSLELARLRAETRSYWEEASRLERAAREYRSSMGDEAQALLRIAEAAYEGGEVGVLELVDAHRGAVEAELLALDLEGGARKARVELERWAGGDIR